MVLFRTLHLIYHAGREWLRYKLLPLLIARPIAWQRKGTEDVTMRMEKCGQVVQPQRKPHWPGSF